MYINLPLEPNEVGYIKVVKTAEPHQYIESTNENKKSKLEINGFTETNEALFKFENFEQSLS